MAIDIHTLQREDVKAAPAAARGERLFPHRSSRVYWILTQLRLALERIVADLSLVQNGTLIDLGCGNMPYRPLFTPKVAKYVGCDFPGNEQATVYLTGDGRVPIAANIADFVLSSQVLEHVAEPNLYLSEAYRILKPEGILILSTHGVWRFHPDPCDFWRWTCQGLRKEIEMSGFRILHFKGVMGPASTALQLWQDAVLGRVPTMFRTVFTFVMQGLIALADRRCREEDRDNDACVYIVLATKTIEST